MTDFDPTIVTAVLAHMNGDHEDDNLLIARAFGDRAAVQAHMVDVDGEAGHWTYATDEAADTHHPVRVAWTTTITERAQIRREIVVVYDRACAELGIAPREHE